MATASPSEEECTCPVCCDIFKDPVLLLCGHSFCKYCLQEWWRQSTLQTCPVCKEVFPMASQPPRNLALRNLSDRLRQEKSQGANSGSRDVCHLHSEKLKLFCEDDQQLICVICRDSQKHKKHNCVPVNEAAEARRTQIKVGLLHLKSKLRMFSSEKGICKSMAGHIKVQAQQTEKTIKEDFQQLHQFLQAEEAARLAAVREEAKLKSEAMNIRIVNLTAEISSLTDKVSTIQREIMADDISFMLNVKSTEQRSQCNLPEPKTPSGALIDEARHIGNLQFRVWTRMKEIIQYTPVTLDPNTGGSLLILSEHMSRSSCNRDQPLPYNQERLCTSAILGSEGFSSGYHWWDVEVEKYWGAGVAERVQDQTPEKIWSIYKISCCDVMCERTPENDVKLDCEYFFSQKLRVQLDYNHGLLSFFDLDRKKTVHTIKCIFTGKVFPFFSENVKILPAEFSVRRIQPK